MKKMTDKEKRAFLVAIILVLVKVALSIASNSVCAITFCQPSEPNNIEKILKCRDCCNVKKVSKVFQLVASLAAALSAIAATGVSASACHFWFAQPKTPQGLDEFKNEQSEHMIKGCRLMRHSENKKGGNQ